jgi:FkbM family methyltransferase
MDNIEIEQVKVGSYTVSIIRDDQYIGNCLRRGYEWDSWMRQDLSHITHPDKDILDIGGNIGWNALMFSEYGPVHTFEPVFYKVLNKNITQNVTRHPITLHSCGLSDVNEMADFWIPKREGSVCNYGASRMDAENFPDYEKILTKIQIRKLDDVYTGTPQLLKIDVEGHELQVLKGAEQTIRKHLPHLYIEIFDMEGPVPKFLAELGYTRILPRPEHNYLFLSPLI